ncbi:MAG TPA: hypothetical protein VD908_19360 [Cytophagales bacterium]|nr:hypothetical protein [Cytophagales bacterium]
MILLIIFLILFSWAVLKGIDKGLALESSRDFEKPQIEYVIPVKQVKENDSKTLNIMDYLREEQEKEELYRRRLEEFVKTIE